MGRNNKKVSPKKKQPVIETYGGISLDPEIKSRNKNDRIATITLIIMIISLFVYILPVSNFVSGIISSLQKTEYTIDIQDGNKFEFPSLNMGKDRFLMVEQKIAIKIKDEKVLFTHKIMNSGQNYLEAYKDNITIVDPIGRVRGEKTINFIDGDKEENFKTIFNFPPNNELLYGEWNIYSYVSSDNHTFSIIKVPFEIKPKDPWYLTTLPGIVGLLMTFFFMLFVNFRRIIF